VNLTTTQVETLFGELEYIEPRLKTLGIADVDGLMRPCCRREDSR